MNDLRIPIAFATDNNYAFPTGVTIASILENSKVETKYNVYILFTEQLNDTKKEIFHFLERKYLNLRIFFIKINSNLFSGAVSFAGHITMPTFYRLILSEVLANEKKCIFMDGDIVVNEDLSDIYQIDMDGYYLAGIRDYDRNIENGENEKHKKILGLDSMADFIYGAPFIMNLEEIRKDNIVAKFYKHMVKGYPLADQDVLNVCCHGKIRFLPLSYDVLPRFLYREDFLDEKKLSSEVINEACNNPKIIHFGGGKVKPWGNTRCKGSKLWWRYAAIMDGVLPIEHMYRNAEEITCKRDWEYILNKCYEAENIIIWGFSATGKEVLRYIKNAHITAVRGFGDNNLELQGKAYEGIEVLPLKRIICEFKNLLVINTSQNYYNEIEKQLINRGIDKQQIVRYDKKNIYYYMALEKKYHKHEIEQIYLAEYGEIPMDLNISRIRVGGGITEKYGLDIWPI